MAVRTTSRGNSRRTENPVTETKVLQSRDFKTYADAEKVLIKKKWARVGESNFYSLIKNGKETQVYIIEFFQLDLRFLLRGK